MNRLSNLKCSGQKRLMDIIKTYNHLFIEKIFDRLDRLDIIYVKSHESKILRNDIILHETLPSREKYGDDLILQLLLKNIDGSVDYFIHKSIYDKSMETGVDRNDIKEHFRFLFDFDDDFVGIINHINPMSLQEELKLIIIPICELVSINDLKQYNYI